MERRLLRITRLTDYGIVLMTRLATDRTRSVHAARDLAAESRIPLPTVAKILKALAHVGLLTSHRGASGGFSLAKDPARISVAEVIESLEGPIAMTECLGEEQGACGIEQGCPARSNWDRINRVVRQALVGLTLEEMARPAFLQECSPLRGCSPPPAAPLPSAALPAAATAKKAP
jgi:FeS assembly SUF system regulator